MFLLKVWTPIDRKKTPNYQTPLKDNLHFVFPPCPATALLTFKQCLETFWPPRTQQADNNKALVDSCKKSHEFKQHDIKTCKLFIVFGGINTLSHCLWSTVWCSWSQRGRSTVPPTSHQALAKNLAFFGSKFLSRFSEQWTSRAITCLFSISRIWHVRLDACWEWSKANHYPWSITPARWVQRFWPAQEETVDWKQKRRVRGSAFGQKG